ncbi:hypothetical protein [uncultured Enterococcus sp.]|uniref:hypothetical protein n=1 Tax=uncultured Enterococcus sp. TaxID=167972 RepID=UPI0025D5B0FA|nr:hypothetical protein [uncultured Enterococcus sp.]
MTNYEKKEEKVFDKIAEYVEKLDETLTTLNELNEDTEKKHRIKKWYESKKSVHEIKRILHEEGKYAKYDKDEMNKIEKEFSDYLN